MKKLKRRSFVSQMLFLFILFHLISVILFSYFLFQQDRKQSNENLEDTLNEIVREKSQLISLVIERIENEAENLARWTENYLEDEEITKLSDEYYTSERGVLVRKDKNRLEKGSSVFLPKNQKIDEKMISMIMQSEKLDVQFRQAAKNIPYISWQAIPMLNGFLRVYPYSEMNMYSSEHMQLNDPFYIEALKQSSSKKSIWSEPYLDFMGTGWCITCTHPIYVNDEVIGFTSIDVNFETIQKDFMEDFRLGKSGISFLLYNSGEIIYHPGVPLSSKTKGDLARINIIKDTNLSPEYKKALEKVVRDKSGVVRYKDGSTENVIVYSSIEGLPWKIAVEVDQNEFASIKIFTWKSLLYLVGLSTILLFFFTYFLLKNYSKPVLSLVGRARKISEGNYEINASDFYYDEINELSMAFDSMRLSIKAYIDELIQKNTEIKTIFNSIGGLLMIVDSEYRILLLNEKGLQLIGKSLTEVVGKKCYDVIAAQSCICPECKLKKVMEEEREDISIIPIKDKIFEISYYPINGKEKNSREVVVYSYDITERIIIEKELSQKEKMAGIGQLSSAIAHELKTPIAVIKGSVYLLRNYMKNIENKKIENQLNIINETLSEAEEIIMNLLDYSRISKLEEREIDIEKLIEQIIFISRKESSRINVKIERNFSHSPFIYKGKVEPIKQVFLNIFTNALTALKNGGNLLIEGKNIMRNQKEYIIVSIIDDGPGIDDKIKATIFDPFVTTSSDSLNTGLGLWITKKILENMNGDIEISSIKGSGTAVHIFLPVN